MKKTFLIIIAIIIIMIAIIIALSSMLFNRYEHGQYGKGGNIVIYWKDGDVDIDVYEKNNKIFSQNKIYYYFESDSYFYAISKWDDYIVIDMRNNEIIIHTDEIKSIPENHLVVFNNKKLFTDMSEEDKKYGYIVSCGNGTVYLRKVSSDTVWLLTQKTDNGKHFEKMISEKIKKYKLVKNYIYLITEDNNCAVVDYDAYVVLYECDSIEDLPVKYQKEFNNGGFNNALEIELYEGR